MLRNSAVRPVRMQCALALCATLALSACASKYAQVPPRLDLEPYGRVALVTFSSEQTDGSLNSLATQRFVEMLLASQSHVEVLELPTTDSALAVLAASGDGAALAQAVGRNKAVPAVFVGQLTVSNVKPRGRVSTKGVDVRGSVAAQLTVRLLSTSTGATVWRSSATASRTVGNVRLTDHNPSIAMRDPDEAYGEVVRDLVTTVTRDLRPTWVKQ
jgi:hypothetical protein